MPTSSSLTIGRMPLSVQNSSISTITATDVAHDETISSIHISVAKAKMAMTRCWTILRFCMPNHSVGMFHSSSVTSSTTAILKYRLRVGLYLRW